MSGYLDPDELDRLKGLAGRFRIIKRTASVAPGDPPKIRSPVTNVSGAVQRIEMHAIQH